MFFSIVKPEGSKYSTTELERGYHQVGRKTKAEGADEKQ